MSCSSCNCNVCSCSVDACGCPQDVNSKCVFYKGTTTSCLGITTGTNLQDIIQAFDAAICDLPTPSGGNTYVVSGTTNQIVVTSTTAGSQTTYTVALSPTITTHLTNIDSDIVTLGNCTATSIQGLTTSSPEITVTPNGASGCGKTWSIDWTPPSGTPNYDGIIYNNTSIQQPSGAGGDQIVEFFKWDYNTNSALAIGDEIRFEISGQVQSSASGVDTVTLEFFDVGTASIISSTTYNAFTSTPVNKISSWEFSGSIVKAAASVGAYKINFETTNNLDFMFINPTFVKRPYVQYSTDFSNLKINLKFNNVSHLVSNNYVHKFMVEVRKKI